MISSGQSAEVPKSGRPRRPTVTIDYGKGGLEELDKLAVVLREAFKGQLEGKVITRSFVARFAIRLLREAVKRNELLRLMRLVTEGAGKSYPPPSNT